MDSLICRVVFYLIDNAMPHGGAITTIRSSDEEKNGSRIVVCEDVGDGVAVEEKELLFDPGYGKVSQLPRRGNPERERGSR
ncbi:MAG TPA: hypothetical protein HA263_09960 [Methanoregulaceae archaeon]|nr:hypothetical protein [Methanoregulaceae archaeon]